MPTKVISLFSILALLTAFGPASTAFAASSHALGFPDGFPFSDVGSFVEGLTSKTFATSSSSGMSGKAVLTGDSSASVNVQNIISGGGENTNVRIDIRTEADGIIHETSIEKIIPAGERVEVRAATSTGRTSADIQVERDAREAGLPTTSPSWSDSIFNKLESTFENMVRAFFGFWR